MAASLRRAGRNPAARAFDALIAETAIANNNLALYTCNPRVFEGIDGLAVVTIAHPDVPADQAWRLSKSRGRSYLPFSGISMVGGPVA